MSALTVSNYTTIGVVLNMPGQNTVTITNKGYVNASAAYTAAVYSALGSVGTVQNNGTLMAKSGVGVDLTSGGTVTNGGSGSYRALISTNMVGIETGPRGTASVVNYGTISITTTTNGVGILMSSSGYAANGSATDRSAYIHSYQSGIVSIGVNANVANFGTIVTTEMDNFASYGIYLRAGGTITNGSNADTVATILSNSLGVSAAIYASTIHNYGTIVTTQHSYADAVLLQGGLVVNGSNSDTAAYLQAANDARAVYVKGLITSTVVNYGTIAGGISLRPGGTVVNGSSVDTQARISAANYGILIGGPGRSTATNWGTVIGSQGRGLIMGGGGSFTNGSVSDQTAYLSGGLGAVYLNGNASGTVANFGTLMATGTSPGVAVQLMDGGQVINGGTADTAAAILNGNTGILILNGSALVQNYGTISGTVGVSFYRANKVRGITMTSSGTVINAGTIESSAGAGGTAIQFGFGTERLVVDPGSVIIGKVIGGSGGNTLELASGGAGSLSGIGTSFTNFGTVVVDSGALWTLAGTNTIASWATLTESGSLTLNGILLNKGSFAGEANLAAGATFANYGTVGTGGTAVSFASNGRLVVGTGASFKGVVAGAGHTSLELAANSAGTLSGLAGGNGTATMAGKTWSFSGMGGTLAVDRSANWTVSGGGTIGAGANIYGTLSVSGGLSVTNAQTDFVSGATARLLTTSTLSLQGATLSAASGGVIEVGAGGTSVASQVVIDAGKTLSGYGTIASPVTDTGTLFAQGGALDVTGRITGTGNAVVGSGATLISQVGLNETSLTFSGTNATVQVTKGTPVASKISGMVGTDTIDFLGTVATSLTFASGKLKVVGALGTIANLSFAGNYTTSNFKIGTDGAGGTNLTTVGLAALTSAVSPGSFLPEVQQNFGLSLSAGGHSGGSATGGGGLNAVSGATGQAPNFNPIALHQF